MEKQPITTEPHFWNNMEFQIEFIPIESKGKMPDLPWGGVYAIGNLDGKVPVVKYPKNIEYPFGLPGGHREDGETIEQSLIREVKEELNMEIQDWLPIGYERVSLKGKARDYKYALYVYATLKKDGEFTEDVGGGVIGYDLIDISEVAPKVKKGERMNYMIKTITPKF
jgi:ADP-ribose pyrophosphatase YjhB (NUDIX family)